jgi:hypothetical protein
VLPSLSWVHLLLLVIPTGEPRLLRLAVEDRGNIITILQRAFSSTFNF